MIDFSECIKAMRLRAGYSQRSTAEYLTEMGVPTLHCSLSKWESGRNEPSVWQFYALCDLYDVTDLKMDLAEVSTLFQKSSLFNKFNLRGKKHLLEYLFLMAENPCFTTQPQEKPKISNKKKGNK